MIGSVGSVVDTNIITKMIIKDSAAMAIFDKVTILYTSVIVVGELFFAAANSRRREENFSKFRNVLSEFEIIPIDDPVCLAFAELKVTLKKKGTPIPDNDVWIAACALSRGLSVATLDRHFSEIPQLEIIRAG